MLLPLVLPQYVSSLFAQLDGLRMSSAFSGIGAADVALATIEEGVHRWRADIDNVARACHRNLFCVEYDIEC